MTVDNRSFILLIVVLVCGFALHGIVSFVAVGQNQERITRLEEERDVTLIKLAKESHDTAHKVVEALTGLTTVISERSMNDSRILNLLEAISRKLDGENYGPQK